VIGYLVGQDGAVLLLWIARCAQQEKFIEAIK